MSPSKPTSSNVLGIDYGSKRIGVAIGDTDSKLAAPLVTLGPEKLTDDLRKLIEENNIDTLVVGLPRNLDGDDTAQTAEARKFAADLENALKLSIVLQDEAGTSRVAADRIGRATEPGEVDREAASIILQDYLDSL